MTNPEGGGKGALIAAVITALLVALFFTYQFSNEPPHWRISLGEGLNFTVLVFFLDRAFYILAAAAVLAACCGAGLAVLAKFDCDGLRPAERLVLAGVFGLGILSVATLMLGLAGLLNRFTAAALVVVLALIGARRARRSLREILAKGFGGRLSALEWFLAAGILVAGLMTLLYSFNPPMNFDALEYHLGAPAQYYRDGAIRYIEYNVYSNFPGNSEMVYLFSMVLAGSKMTGAVLGKVLHAYAAFLAALAAWCLGGRLHSRGAGLFAAFALLSSGSFFEVSTGVYVEGLQTLYTLAALLCIVKFLSGGRHGWLKAGGICAGLAFGVKYPAALFVILPLSAAVLLRRAAVRERLVSLGIFAGISLAVAAPWLLKNLIFTGNPAYPLLHGILGGRDWGDLQNARWIMAHTPKGGLAWRQWAEHVFGRFFAEGHGRVSLLSFAFIPFAFAARARSKRILFAAAYAALYIFLWFAVTHRIVRFLVPALAVAGAVSGAGLFSLTKGLLRNVLGALTVVLGALCVFYLCVFYGATPDPTVPLLGAYDEFLAETHSAYEAWGEAAEIVPPGARVLLHGEAETFYLEFDFKGTTVFDRKFLEEVAEGATSPGDIGARIKETGFSYVFANWATFRRQQETYRFEYAGVAHEGYSDIATAEFFERMCRANALEVVYSSGGEVFPGTPSHVLYRVK